MLQLRRRNVAWLTIIGGLVAISLLSAAAPANVQLALVGILAF